MAEAAAQIPEPFNVHAWLVKPSGFGAGVTFTQDRKLLVLEAEWEWLAKGGSGPAMFKVEGDLGDPDTYVTDGWEIILDLRLQPEVNYTRWYRGRIVDVKAAVVASKTVTSIRVQGQWASEATAVKLDNDYTAGNQDVKTIIGDILDNQGVDTETRIVYDASLIAASTYTPATFDAVGSASRVIAALAETQGSREFDIDPDTRKFRMAAEVTTVPERNVYIVGKDVKELDSGDAHDRGTNTILVTGRNDGGQARTEEVSDATDQTAYGKKMRHVILPYMSAAADLTQWANNQISDLKGRQEYSIFEIPDVQSRVEGTAPPIGNIKLWRRKSDGTSEAVSLPLHKVRYSFGVACDADYDMPDCTPGEIRPRGRTIKAMVFIGNPPPNIPEWNEKIELEKERISIWIWQGQNPDKYAGDPNSNLPEGRQWTEKLVANTVAKDLYMCTDTTGPVFVRIGGQNLAFKDEANAFTQENSFGSQKLTSVADPTSAQDAATKAYVDAVAIGIDWKPSVRVATTANITLSGEPQTIDGVSVVTGDRVLVKNQTAGAENGIYVVATGAWTRATDADTSAEVTSGIGVTVSEGSTLADTGWMLTTNDPITLGTTALVFTLFGTSLTAFARTLLDDTTDVQALVTLGAAALNVAQTFAGLQTFGDGIATGNVAEAVVGAGVTVDGCLIQDGVAANAGLLDGLDSLAFLKADGTVNLTGNLAVTAGVTIDGYDLGATLDIAVLDTDIGVTVQAFDATLTSIAALGTVADRTIYTTGIDTWAETTLTAFARTLLDDVDDAAARATLDAPGLSVANAFTADQRLANDIYLTGLNAAGTTTYDLIGLNTSNRLLIGQGGPLQVDVDAAAGTFNVEDGEVTVSGALPKFRFIDTTAGHDDWSFFANASAFQIKNETSGLVALWLNSGGDFLLNGGGVQLCDQTGKLYQLGVAITATAIELNKMDGVTLTFDQINEAALKNAANTFSESQTIKGTGDPSLIIDNDDVGGGSWDIKIGDDAATPAGAWKLIETGGATRFVVDTLARPVRFGANGVMIGSVAVTPAVVGLHLYSESPTVRFESPTAAFNTYDIAAAASFYIKNITANPDRIDFKIADTGVVTIGDQGVTNELIVTPGSGIVVAKDVDATGGFRTALEFEFDQAAGSGATTVAVTQKVTAGTALYYIFPYRAGSLVGISASKEPATSGGTAVFTVYKNNVATALAVTIADGQNNLSTTAAKDSIAMATNNYITVKVVNNGTSAINAVVHVWLEC